MLIKNDDLTVEHGIVPEFLQRLDNLTVDSCEGETVARIKPYAFLLDFGDGAVTDVPM